MRPKVIDAPEDIWLGYSIIDDSGHVELIWRRTKAGVDDTQYTRVDLAKTVRRKFEHSIYPQKIWLNYGDLDRDATHAEVFRDGDVTWCKEQVFDSDVMYVRADLVIDWTGHSGRISNGRRKLMSDTAYWNQIYANALAESEPSYRYRPRLSIDGDQWCALYGDNLQDGVAGFGDSPGAAYWDFDRAWWAAVKGKAERD